MVRRLLGVSVSASIVRGVLLEGGTIRWAGSCAHTGPADLPDVIARLASECGRPVRRVRVVLERDLLQCRTMLPAPRLKARAIARYVALEAPRLFRTDGGPVLTDAALVRVGRQRALWAVAGPERFARAVAAGCEEAGLALGTLGAASEVLPASAAGATDALAFPRGGATEVLSLVRGRTWRGRLLRGTSGVAPRWVPALAALGGEAGSYAAAFGAAVATPRLLLLPAQARAAAAVRVKRNFYRLAVGAAASWLVALGIYGARVAAVGRQTRAELARMELSLDSALDIRRDLMTARAASARLRDAARERSRSLALLAALTTALGDSAVLVGFRVSGDSALHLAGYAPVAARVLADLERVRALRGVRLDGPPSREVVGAGGGIARAWDRFSIAGALGTTP